MLLNHPRISARLLIRDPTEQLDIKKATLSEPPLTAGLGNYGTKQKLAKEDATFGKAELKVHTQFLTMKSPGSVSKQHTVRSSIACELCRKSKIKCQNPGDDSPCERCLKIGCDCIYKPKGYQQVRRSLKKNRSVSLAPQIGKVCPESSTKSTNHSVQRSYKKNYYSTRVLTSIKLPPKFLLIKVINIFFSNQYNGIFQFLHKETYLKHYEESRIDQEYLLNINLVKEPEFDPLLLLAILSICARFEPSMVEIYGAFSEDNDPEGFEPSFNLLQSEISNASKTPNNTSKYFGYYARNLVSDIFDRPSVQRVQALAILSSHEWGNSNASRSYLYNGIAARMAVILGLSNPNSLCYQKIESNGSLSQFEKNVKLESIRRTMWSVYMMDRANASGRNRSFAIKIDEIQIPMPCYDFEFSNGMRTNYLNYDDSLVVLASESREKNVSPLGFQIFFFELWSKIAKWCGEDGALKENLSPENKNSNFNRLHSDLSILESTLPENLKFNIENLNHNIKINNVEHYGYLHCLIMLSKIFLFREVFYLKNSKNLITFASWWQYTQNLLKTVKDCSNLIKTLKAIKLIVDSPFLAFQIFTNATICLYFVDFSNEVLQRVITKDSLLKLKQDYKELGDDNINLLKKNVWAIGQKYYSIIEELNDNNLKHYLLDDDFKNKIHDYGQGEVSEQIYPPQKPNFTKETTLESNRLADDTLKSPRSTPVARALSPVVVQHNSNLNDLVQVFGYENWEIFDMGNVLPGWNKVISPYSTTSLNS